MPIEEKISVDYSELDDAEKAAKSLETTVKSSEAAQNKAVKEGINERTQTIRDGLAAQLKETRAGTSARVKEAQEALRKEEISEKEYAKRIVQINLEASKQIASIKATRSQLVPQQVEQASQRSSGLGGFAIGAIGVGALAAGLKGLAQAATTAESTLQGLDSVVGYKLGKQSIPQAHEELEKITKTGLLSKSDGAAAIKNLVSMGYALDDATKIILRNTDVAVKNRQANYSVSESVKIFTEGLKNGNSTLTDSTGIQTNISVMLKKHGASLDDLNDKQRAGAARQAILNEVMAETAPFVGDAEKASKSYAGAIAKLSAAWDETAAAGGGFIASVLTPLINIMTSALVGVKDFLKDMDGVNAAIIAITATAALIVGWGISFIGTMGGVGGMMVAISAKATAMWVAITGPIGIAIGLIAAAGAAIYAIYNATKATPGQLLIQEKQQLEALVKETDNAKNKTKEYEQAKKRLSDINKQVTAEYGPYLKALGLEGIELEKNIGLIREIDKVRKDVKNNTKEEGAFEIKARIDYKGVDIKTADDNLAFLKKMNAEVAAGTRNWSASYSNEAVEMAAAKAQEERIKLAALKEQAEEKKPKPVKSSAPARVPETYVADMTTVQQLEDMQRFYNERAEFAREGAEAEKIAEEQRTIALQLGLAKRQFLIGDGNKKELVSLDELERQKAGLEAGALKAVTNTQKADIAAALKVNQQKLAIVQKRIQAESQLESEHQSWKKRAGQEMYEFGQALLSAEEGSFLKYLANKLRQYTAEKSAELYAEAAGAAATGNFGLAALYTAGGAAVQIAGEFGARALEKEAEKKSSSLQNGSAPDLGGIASPSAPDISSAAPGTSVTNITNVVTNEYGTYIREADFIRKQVRPEIQKMAAERGKVMFK